MPQFRRGDRVVLSDTARQVRVHPRQDPDREGVVTGFAREGFPRVRWDGNARGNINVYHPKFVEVIQPMTPASGCFTCGGQMLDSDRGRILSALCAGDLEDIELAQRLAREWEITVPHLPKETTR